ncbi:MAG: 50S ribosomal protein L23 [Mycoplasmatales bacterium]
MAKTYDIIIRPIITEKSMIGVEKKVYTFEVDKTANKTHVKQAIEELYEGVKVEKVNIVNQKPRPRRMGRFSGYKRTFKKAIVTLTKDSKEIKTFDV